MRRPGYTEAMNALLTLALSLALAAFVSGQDTGGTPGAVQTTPTPNSTRQTPTPNAAPPGVQLGVGGVQAPATSTGTAGSAHVTTVSSTGTVTVSSGPRVFFVPLD